MEIKIKNRLDDSVIYSHDCEDNTIKITVEQAVKEGVSLQYADLAGANLRNANLHGAYLFSVNLNNANLLGADLCYADLQYANLRGADLAGTVFEDLQR